jgi:tRNA G18 (ribose-2'-O)-methylase SpoU
LIIFLHLRSIIENPFEVSIALMPGNEGTGLSDRQKSVVDYFVYIPQYGHGTASLNVTVATTMVMHRYVCWSNSIASQAQDKELTSVCGKAGGEK